MTEPETTPLSEDELSRRLLKVHRAALRAGISWYEIEPLLLRRVRQTLSLTPQQARSWFYPRLIQEGEDGRPE